MLTIEEHIDYWIDSAENDLKASENMYNSGNYDWSLFIGHLVLEKVLKALYVKNNNNLTPPKIHNLLRLAELSNLELSFEQSKFLQIVNNFQIEARYPEYKKQLYDMASKDFTQSKLVLIKEYFVWLKSLIK
jgi:HEPN domain-containing protein